MSSPYMEIKKKEQERRYWEVVPNLAIHLGVCGAHLSVSTSIRPVAGRAGPVAVVGVPVGVIVSVRAVALLVHGAVVVMVVMVVTTVLGPAAVPLALLGRKVARLRGRAEVCAQT